MPELVAGKIRLLSRQVLPDLKSGQALAMTREIDKQNSLFFS
jgi:hypothetical protein